MKKLILIGVVLLLAVLSYNFNSNSVKHYNAPLRTVVAPPDTVHKTLNGVREADAKAMMAYFSSEKCNDRSPKRISVWFDRATINNMVSLVEGEALKEHKPERQRGTIDGIRLYFVADQTINGRHLSNSIQFVSTRYFDKRQSADGRSMYTHYDYYGHSKNALVFGEDKMELSGKTERFYLTRSLHNIFNLYYEIRTNQSNCGNPHSTPRGLAYKMVNHFGHDTIRTVSEWFDLCFFKSIAHNTTDNIDGVRIYFAKHPKSYRGDTIDANKDAFVIVPTVPKQILGKIYHKDDYDICLPVCDSLSQTAIGLHLLMESYDKGALCPENCNLDSNSGYFFNIFSKRSNKIKESGKTKILPKKGDHK